MLILISQQYHGTHYDYLTCTTVYSEGCSSDNNMELSDEGVS